MHKFLDCRDDCKIPNTIYNSLIGGNSRGFQYKPWYRVFLTSSYDWHCLYNKLRITYDKHMLLYGWRHHSLHWNNVNNGGIAWHFHWATNTKFPFIKIGFKNIRDLYKEF